MTRTRISRPFALAALLLLLGACNVVPPPQDDPTRFFVLSDGGAPARPAEGGARIALRAVQVDGYLKRREMVVRTAPNELQFRDYRRWAEPVDAAINRVLREGLLASPGVGAVFTEPFSFDMQADYTLTVTVTRFEGVEEAGRGSARMSAVFELSTAGSSPRLVARRQFEAPAQAWDGRDFGRLAGLLSADVAALARQVASAIPAGAP
ncbi:MAG TPA: PqiC family protein [Opitutaceae bacterium]|jgi:hypothetical protein